MDILVGETQFLWPSEVDMDPKGQVERCQGKLLWGFKDLQPKNIAWFWQVSTEEEEEEEEEGEEDPSPTPLTAEALSTLVFYMEIHLPFLNSPNVQLF